MFGRGHRRCWRLLGVLGAFGACLALAAGAHAATFTVTTTADTFDGTCNSNCSLRDAIEAANGGDGNTVSIPAGIFRLNTTDDPMNFGELTVDATMTVTGAGARNTIIDANGRSRVFRATDDSGGLTINDLTVTGGHNPVVDPPVGYVPPVPEFDSEGGGIFVQSPLTLNRVTVRNNSARLAGGGVMNEPPESDSLEFLTITIDRSTIANNTVEGGASNGQGGGIAAFGNLTMTNSTVTGNSAKNGTGNEGGGIIATAGDLQADSIQDAVSGIVRFTNVTIAGNSIVGSAPLTFGGGFSGDALFTGETPGPIFYSSLIAKNTIIANNTINGAKSDCAFVNTTSTTNNISSDGSCGFADSASKQGTDPGLLPLEHRGGPTDTMGLTPTSAATNTGTNSGCPLIDQRGVARPLVGNCDVGAVELALPTPVTGAATGITTSSATITGDAGNPHVDGGTTFFQFGTTLDYGSTTTAQPLAALARKKRRKRSRRRASRSRAHSSRKKKRSRRRSSRRRARASAARFSASLTGLRAGRVYHYRIGATNRDGTVFGKDRTFRVLSRPAVTVAGVPRSCVRGAFRLRVRTRVARASRLRSVRVSLDGKVIKRSKSSRFTVRISGSSLSSGRHRIVVVATDRGGRTRTVRRSFTRCRRPQRIAPQFTG